MTQKTFNVKIELRDGIPVVKTEEVRKTKIGKLFSNSISHKNTVDGAQTIKVLHDGTLTAHDGKTRRIYKGNTIIVRENGDFTM